MDYFLCLVYHAVKFFVPDQIFREQHLGECLLSIGRHQKSKEDLGFELTKEFYENKIRQGKPFNVKLIQQKLDDLIDGKGETLFEILVEIIGSHQNIRLILD